MDIETKILHFYYKCKRKNKEELVYFVKDFIQLVENTNDDFIHVIFCLICHVRDIHGLGERDLSYRMIFVFYQFYPWLAKKLLSKFVFDGIGSWKDIKYFCGYVKDYLEKEVNNLTVVEENAAEDLICYCVGLVCKQLKEDCILSEQGKSFSLCAKWVPREKSNTFGWLFKQIACSYLPDYCNTANSASSLSAACKKTFMEFSSLLAILNNQLRTTEIYMCGKEWAEIEPNHVPQLATKKYSSAFLNVSKKRGISLEPDRILCAENFKNNLHLQQLTTEIVPSSMTKGIDHPLYQYIQYGMNLINSCRYSENKTLEIDKENLNQMWNQWIKDLDGTLFQYMVPIVDKCMTLQYNASIGLGLMISHFSIIGKRILSFSKNPSWISCADNFYDSLNHFQQHTIGILGDQKIDFYKVYSKLLLVCIENEFSQEVVGKMIFAVFSDTHINMADTQLDETLVLNIQNLYKKHGYSVLPNILFWDLKDHGMFPCIYFQQLGCLHISMMTGLENKTIDCFCKNGITSLYEMTPWFMLNQLLQNPRYKNVVLE